MKKKSFRYRIKRRSAGHADAIFYAERKVLWWWTRVSGCVAYSGWRDWWYNRDEAYSVCVQDARPRQPEMKVKVEIIEEFEL